MLGCGQLCPQLEDASKLQDPRFDVRCRSLHQHTHACLYLTPTAGERGAALPRRTGRAGRPSSGRRVRGGRATLRRARCRPPPLAAGRAGRPAGPAGTRRACHTAGAGGHGAGGCGGVFPMLTPPPPDCRDRLNREYRGRCARAAAAGGPRCCVACSSCCLRAGFRGRPPGGRSRACGCPPGSRSQGRASKEGKES